MSNGIKTGGRSQPLLGWDGYRYRRYKVGWKIQIDRICEVNELLLRFVEYVISPHKIAAEPMGCFQVEIINPRKQTLRQINKFVPLLSLC